MAVRTVGEFRDLYNQLVSNRSVGPSGEAISENEFRSNLLGAYRNLNPGFIDRFVLQMTTDIPSSLLYALDTGNYNAYATRRGYTLSPSQRGEMDRQIDNLCSQVLHKKKAYLTDYDFQNSDAFDHEMMNRLQVAAYSGNGISKGELRNIIANEVHDAGPSGKARWEGREKLTLMIAIRDLPFASPEALEAAVACTEVKAGGHPDQECF